MMALPQGAGQWTWWRREPARGAGIQCRG